MRAAWFLLLVSLTACGGQSRLAAGPPSRSDLQSAWQAYQRYCESCSGAATCCLTQADFQPTNWSDVAAPYLRAMRDHYDCMFGDALVESGYQAPALVGQGEFQTLPTVGNFRRTCELTACAGSAQVMAAELDRALVTVPAHPEGALVVCSASSTQ